MFTLGGLSGVMHAVVPIDTQQQDSYFIVAHFHYVLFGGSIFGLVAGIYYWFPKMSGRMLGEGMGRAHFWTMLIGFNLTFMPMHILGVLGMPRRVYTYPEGLGWDELNLMTTVGSAIIALSVLMFIANILRSLRQGEIAGANPWGAATLEWAIPSPPPHYNFAVVPTVRSQHPLWDEEANPVEPPPLPAYDEPHMPSPSYWPIVLAFGMTMMAGGLIVWQAQAVAGIVMMASMGLLALRSVYAWVVEPLELEEEADVPVHH